jgi:mono/diheme cytochrome c family protein
LACALAWAAVSCGPARSEPERAAQAPAKAQEAAAATGSADPGYCVAGHDLPTSGPLALASVKTTGGPAAAPPAAPPSAAAVAKGQTLFRSYGCAVCHGKEGHGDGLVARTLNPKPRNFHDASAYKLGGSVPQIANTIKNGVPGSQMAAYPQIPVQEREQIAAYLVSLQKKP